MKEPCKKHRVMYVPNGVPMEGLFADIGHVLFCRLPLAAKRLFHRS